jgi:hypothetical protein
MSHKATEPSTVLAHPVTLDGLVARFGGPIELTINPHHGLVNGERLTRERFLTRMQDSNMNPPTEDDLDCCNADPGDGLYILDLWIKPADEDRLVPPIWLRSYGPTMASVLERMEQELAVP